MKFAVLDFETTGDQPYDVIIQVGLVMIEQNRITDRYTTLVNPGRGIPDSISRLTGITDEMVADAPSMEDVIVDMLPLLNDAVLVAHHAAFDEGFLQRALTAFGYLPFSGRVLDTLDFLRVLFPSLTSLQLSMAANAFHIPHDRPHQADSDAEVTAELWLRCMQRLHSLPLLTLQRLAYMFLPEVSDMGWFIQTQCQQKENETSIDENAVHYYRQFAIRAGDWGDELPVRSDDHIPEPLDVPFEVFYEQFKHNLQQRFEVFEERAAQDEMIREVQEAMESSRHLMVEAGTGTGKSLGYLIPALYYGIRESKRVVISTQTINLQEQLRQRDIPLLNEIFPVPFKASVLKGRSHYLCLRKFENKINIHDFESEKEDRITAGQMVVWLSETQHGDDEELHFGYKGASFWHTVASDTDSCLNRACPWFKKCFYHRARHEANHSDVVITNHSLLFTDVKAEQRLLPSYDHLIVDEAHQFDETASKHLGINVHYNSMTHTLLWLFKDSKSGQLPNIRFKLQKHDPDYTAQWVEAIDECYPELVDIKETWDQLTDLLYQLLAAGNDSAPNETGQMVVRLKKDALPRNWDKYQAHEENFYLKLTQLLKKLDRLLMDWKEVQEEYDIQGLVTDVTGIVKDLYRYRDDLHFFMHLADENYVYWMEANTYNKQKSLQFLCVPVDVSAMLRQHFFDNKASIVMTSATLSVDKSFRYFCDQFGLPADDPESVRTVQLESPFNYRDQALVCIPKDFPSIRGYEGEKAFTDALIESLRDIAVQTQGRMLVLFTSNRMLKQTYYSLKEQLYSYGIGVIGQGVDSNNRSKLTRTFLSNKSMVLLGTSSFWEGVDIPGEALSCLAIVRLPFQPPNHPLVEAKCEVLKKHNKNPFMHYSVPQAVIRFKQGFGRLIRTANDKGIVIIYDTRVIDTQYGKYFLYSLPGPKIEMMSNSQIVPRIREWMEGQISV